MHAGVELETALSRAPIRYCWQLLRFMVWLIGGLAAGAGGLAAEPDSAVSVQTRPAAEAELVQAIDRQLVLPAPGQIAVIHQQALDSLDQLERSLADQAVGPLLNRELQLADLRRHLAQLSTAPGPGTVASLEACVPVLRRVVPGHLQGDLDELRHAVMALAAVYNRSPQTIAAARQSLAAVCQQLTDRPAVLSAEDDSRVRDAFASVVRLVADADLQSQLRQAVSQPNAIVQLRTQFVQQLAAQRVTRPINLRQAKAGTVITGQGEVQVDLSAELPESVGSCRLVVRAEGRGEIDAAARRRRARVTATASPTVSGWQPIVISPRTITPAAAAVTARLRTRLNTLSIGGLLGRCRLVRRLATRMVQRQLAAADPAAARSIEAEVGRTVEAEGLLLASRVNSLLTWGVWDRLAAIDFTPAVLLANNRAGATSGTFYARGDQLAALSPPPVVAAEQSPRVALVTKVHESAVNNLFTGFGGLTLDEATVRALWEVQLKLADAAWERLPPARLASTISLRADEPLEVHLGGNGIQLSLRPTAGCLAGAPLRGVPAEIRLSYQFEQNADGLCFRRTDCQFSGDVDAGTAAAWTELIDLFAGRQLRPLPRYRTSITASWLRVVHATLERGWLVVVTEMIDNEPPSLNSF